MKTRTLPVIVLLLIFLTGCFPHYDWDEAINSHDISQLELLEVIWQQAEVIVPYTYSVTPLVAASRGKVAFLGRLGIGGEDGIYVLDSSDGSMVWNKKLFDMSTITANSDALYVGESDLLARISKYNMDTGDLIWRRHERSNSLLSIITDGEEVSAYYNPDIFLVYKSENGRRIRKYKSEDPIYLSTDEITYRRSPGSIQVLQTIETKSHEVIWEVDIEGQLLDPPVFSQDHVFLKDDRGKVYAVERETGEYLWTIEERTISNVAVGGNIVFVILKEGLLVGLDAQTGKTIVKASFSSTPFIVSGEEAVDGYYVAVDSENKVVLAFLGDSQQLFAFQILEE